MVVVVTGVEATVVVGTVVTETLGAAIELLVAVSSNPALVVLGGEKDDFACEEVVVFFLAPKALLLGGFIDLPKVRVGVVLDLLEAWDFSGDLPTTPLNCSGSVKSSCGPGADSIVESPGTEGAKALTPKGSVSIPMLGGELSRTGLEKGPVCKGAPIVPPAETRVGEKMVPVRAAVVAVGRETETVL